MLHFFMAHSYVSFFCLILCLIFCKKARSRWCVYTVCTPLALLSDGGGGGIG